METHKRIQRKPVAGMSPFCKPSGSRYAGNRNIIINHSNKPPNKTFNPIKTRPS